MTGLLVSASSRIDGVCCKFACLGLCDRIGETCRLVGFEPEYREMLARLWLSRKNGYREVLEDLPA